MKQGGIMRTLCDNCESAAAIVFCAADEAALCASCDKEVHMCNKLASRHLRLGLTNPCEFLRCDICENAHAFLYCEKDGSSLCLQCDMVVHVGGKRGHNRYLLWRQKVEFPRERRMAFDEVATELMDQAECRKEPNHIDKCGMKLQMDNHNQMSTSPIPDQHFEDHEWKECYKIDLNTRPQWMHEHSADTGNGYLKQQ